MVSTIRIFYSSECHLHRIPDNCRIKKVPSCGICTSSSSSEQKCCAFGFDSWLNIDKMLALMDQRAYIPPQTGYSFIDCERRTKNSKNRENSKNAGLCCVRELNIEKSSPPSAPQSVGAGGPHESQSFVDVDGWRAGCPLGFGSKLWRLELICHEMVSPYEINFILHRYPPLISPSCKYA